MKKSSAVLKSFIVPGLLVFSLVASVSAQGLSASRTGRHSSPIMPPTPIQDPSCVTPPSGLVGWWKGDGSTLDSVFGNNGVAQNITYTNGIVGQAFACDPNNFPYGTYTGIQIPDRPAYVLTNSLSIEGWVRSRGDGYCIFWRGDNRPGMDPYFIGMSRNNNIKFLICDQDGNTVTVGTYLTYNQWTHVAATLDGSTGTMSIYTNGVLADQTVTAVRPFGDLIPEDSPGVGIGNLNDGQNNFPFTGDIDEISLYNRALTAAEVQAIYNAGSAGKCAVACVSPPSGLISWWPGEGNANDIMGNNNGFLQGGINFTAGEVGQAFNFDGVDDGISVPASSSLNVGAGQGMTLECWIAPTSVANQEPLMEWSGNGGSIHNGVHFWLSVTFAGVGGPGCIYANIVDSVGGLHIFASPTGIVQAGMLQHVALTYDKASGVGKIYYNGSLVSSGNLGSFTPKTDTSFLLGRRMDFGDLYYQGVIDESAIFNRALSTAEVQAIYSAGSAGKCPITAPTCVSPPSGLIGWWPAEGNGNDSAGTNNATVPDGVTYAPAEVGQGFSLDGQDHRIIVPDAPELNFSSNQDFSIEVWILPLASPDNWKDVMSVVDKRVAPDTITQLGYELNLEGGVVVFEMADTLAPFSWHNFSGGPDLRDGQFHHVAVTVQRNSTSGGQLYIDGQMVLTFDPTVCPGDLSNTGPLRIGNHATPDLPAFYHGIIDEISLYNRALSSNEIASIYSAGNAGKCAGPLPPGIAVPPVNQTTVEGSNVVLSVVAGGTGPFSYQWSFNGTNIFGATNATLTLTNLHPNQSGNYAVTITTPYGSITSSNASVTVIAQNILVYKYAGIQKIITSGLALSYAYAGQMFFIPDNTNGVFVGWATIKGKKQYWVNPLPEYLWITIPGATNQSFTVLGQAGQGIDTNGCPKIWADLHKGQNTVLTIGQKKYFSFPNTFASDATHVYPDSQTGKMVLSESSSRVTFMAQSTQNANDNGQTLADLVNSLTKSLASQGYQTQ